MKSQFIFLFLSGIMALINQGDHFMWQHWVNLLAGLWIIISPYVGFTASAMTTNLIITGIVIGVLALWGGLETSNQRMGTAAR